MTTPYFVITNDEDDVLRKDNSLFPTLREGEISTQTTITWPGWPTQLGKKLKFASGQYFLADSITVSEAKAITNDVINSERAKRNQSFFIFNGKSIACDSLSRSDIDGVNGLVCLTGELPPGFPGQWKALDNSFVAIPDKATWISFYAAMVAQGTENFTISQQLKQQLNEALTVDEVLNITWS